MNLGYQTSSEETAVRPRLLYSNQMSNGSQTKKSALHNCPRESRQLPHAVPCDAGLLLSWTNPGVQTFVSWLTMTPCFSSCCFKGLKIVGHIEC